MGGGGCCERGVKRIREGFCGPMDKKETMEVTANSGQLRVMEEMEEREKKTKGERGEFQFP